MSPGLTTVAAMHESHVTRRIAEHVEDIDTLLGWAYFSSGATTLGGVEEALTRPLPEDVADAVQRLRDVEVTAQVAPGPLDLLGEWQQGLDVRQTDILRHRLLVLGPGRMTLDELGTRHGVTRERVRQLESRLLQRFRDDLDAPRFRSVRWALFQLESGLGAFAPDSEVPLGTGAEDDSGPFRLLLHIGGYVHDAERGAVRKGGFKVPRAEQLPLIDEGPLVDEAALEKMLLEWGVVPAHMGFAITSIEKVRRLDGSLVLWPGNIAHKGVAVLAVRGRPMTTDEVADVIDEGFNRRGFRDRLFSDPRTVRTSRLHVGLGAWGLPEYGGVVPAMVERLSAGPMPLNDLAEELASRFEVSAASVRSYSAAPVFLTSGGTIELRPPDEPFVPEVSPSEVAGLYRHDTDRLAWHVRTDRDVLRGSGRSVPDELGVFVAGGPPMTATLRHPAKEVSLTWSDTSHTGPSIGSIRVLAEFVSAQEGDLLRLVVDRADHTITVHLVDESVDGDPRAALAELTGLGASHLASQEDFAGTVDTDAAGVVDLLRGRGDDVIAGYVAMLPPERER